MPLPTPGSKFPPPEFDDARDRMDTWEAWWSGDADQLRDRYENHGFTNRPSQHAGGIVGRAARMWWGRPAPANEPDTKLHCPLAGDICRASADLLFSEPLTATSDDQNTSTALDELLDEGMQAKLLEAAEVQAALGGVYLRPVADPSIADRAWLDVVTPECALPEWRWGRLAAVTFWKVVQAGDGQVWRHFQRYEPGFIVHALYQGTDEQVGRPVPLPDVDSLAGLAGQVDEFGRAATGYPRLSATYIPNMLPNRRWRKRPALAPMGRSDLDGIEPMLDALDETYSAWMRDVRLGKGRVHVPGGMLDDHGPGRGASWNPDREVYSEIPGMLGSRDSTLTVSQFAIRVDEHRETSREWVQAALRHAGYALQTLGMTGDGQAVTATEINARERRSFITRDRKIGYWRPALASNALPALLACDALAFPGRRTGTPGAPVHVEFADSVSEDMLTLANTADVLNRADAASTEVKVRLVHPGWSDTQVANEVAAIQTSRGPALAAPFDYTPGQLTETDDQRATDDDADEEVPA